ncbi:MAG: hypothetical protein OHK0045_02880 [Raineya sp.]
MEQIKNIYKADFPQEVFIRNIIAESAIFFFQNYVLPNSDKNLRVLDVGCGKQPFRSLFEEMGFQYVGLDYKQNQYQNVEVVEAIDTDFLHKYQHIEAFDIVVCTEVLEHVALWEKAFENIAHLTKPDGKVFITCPHFYPLHEEPYDFWRPTTHTLRYFASKYNFEILHLSQIGSAWDVLGTLLNNTSFYIKSNKIKDRILFRIFNFLYTHLKKMLLKNTIQKKIGVHSQVYLSNIAVLKKL